MKRRGTRSSISTSRIQAIIGAAHPLRYQLVQAEARSDLACGGRKTGRAKHEPLEAFDEISPRSEKAKSRVSACFQGTAFLHRRHGNPGSRASWFGHLTRNRDCTGHAGSPSENKTHSKR